MFDKRLPRHGLVAAPVDIRSSTYNDRGQIVSQTLKDTRARGEVRRLLAV